MAYLAMQPQEDLSSAVSEEGASRPRTRVLSTTEEEIKPDLCPVEITISSETRMNTCGNDYPERSHTTRH